MVHDEALNPLLHPERKKALLSFEALPLLSFKKLYRTQKLFRALIFLCVLIIYIYIVYPLIVCNFKLTNSEVVVLVIKN